MYDLNDADPQRDFDIIPDGTIAEFQIKVRPGSAGEDGWLRTSKDGNSEGLDLEFTIVRGEHAKRKVWVLLTLDGKTDGHAEAARISQSKIRGILESARGVKPNDTSEAAKAARRLNHYGELQGLRFIGRIGVQPPVNGFKARNTLDLVVTPDRVEWHPIEQVAVAQGAKESAPAPNATKPAPAKIEKPTWAS